MARSYASFLNYIYSIYNKLDTDDLHLKP